MGTAGQKLLAPVPGLLRKMNLLSGTGMSNATAVPSPLSASAVHPLPKPGLHNGDVMAWYSSWPEPIVIVSDGPYGLGSYPGDPPTHDGLAEWYKPHIEQWSKKATPQTTLWFWNSEIGWATVHPILAAAGLEVSCLSCMGQRQGSYSGECQYQDIADVPSGNRSVRPVCSRVGVLLPTVIDKP